MSDTLVGRLLTGKESRDAIHVAVVAVRAIHDLKPGDHVGLVPGTVEVSASKNAQKKIGIVDPFLTQPVEIGDYFWLFLYQNTITSLNHHWTHPAFDDIDTTYARPSEKLNSEQWLRNYADELIVGFKDLIDSAHAWIDYEDYMVRGGILEGVSTHPAFWEHFEKYTGKVCPKDKQNNFFSCSC